MRMYTVLLATCAALPLFAKTDGYLPTYREANIPQAKRQALQRELPAQLAAAKARLESERAALARDLADASGAFVEERVNTRLGMADRLVACIEKDIARGDVSSLCFAEIELEDLKLFCTYFAGEREAWKSSPERPGVRATEVKVSDYGARGDGVSDDGDAFVAAIEAVRRLGGAPSVLSVPSGDFYIGHAGGGGAHLDFSGISNCVVSGTSPERTRILFGAYDAKGIFASWAHNMVLRNFEIRWKVEPFFQGTLLAANMEEGWFEVDHDAGTLAPDDPKWRVRKHSLGLHTYEKDGTFIKSDLLWWDRSAKNLGGGRYRLGFDRKMSSWKNAQPPAIGAKAVLPDRFSGFPAVGFTACRFCTLDRVWCRNSREAFFVPSAGFACSAVRCRIFPMEGRVFSTNADGFYNARGSWISSCEFCNMGDDGCNSVMRGGDIAKAEGRILRCKPFSPLKPRAGEMWQLVESTTGEYLANLRVVSGGVVRQDGAGWVEVELQDPVPDGLNTYETIGRGPITERERRDIALGNLKMTRPPDLAFAPQAYGTGAVVARNRFRNNRNTGIVVMCPNMLVEDNVVEGMQNGMRICMLLNWNEGPAPYNVLIWNNLFANTWYGILATMDMHNSGVPRTRPMRHVSIVSNVFAGVEREVIRLAGADAPVLEGNVVPLGPFQTDCERSVLNKGNAARLEAVFAKAARGESISIAALGGSITIGAGAGSGTNRWSRLVSDWFARQFPNAVVKRTNAGIGATGSRLGTHRIARDVAPAAPDLVLVDFSVNDHAGEKSGETLEGCVRQLLRLPSAPAVVLVSFLAKSGVNVQEEHLAVARHYGLPHLSVKDAVWPRIERGEISWSDYSDDTVHPNRRGHPYAAAIVTDFLEKRLADWRAGRRAAQATFPQTPLFGDRYDHGRLRAAPDVRPTENVGFKPGPRREFWPSVMVGTRPGDRYVFETDSPALTLAYWRLRADFGRARVTVDGKEAAVLDGWYDATWGGYSAVREIYRDCPGRHVVSIEILPEKTEGSTGNRFELVAVLEQER